MSSDSEDLDLATTQQVVVHHRCPTRLERDATGSFRGAPSHRDLGRRAVVVGKPKFDEVDAAGGLGACRGDRCRGGRVQHLEDRQVVDGQVAQHADGTSDLVRVGA